MFTLGLDFGTNSVRALIVRCADGAEFGSAIAEYASGKAGVLLDPKDHNLARQHPGDYLFGLERSVKEALALAKRRRGFSAEKIIGIGVDATTCSIMPVDTQNRPLALAKKWSKRLDAQCWLWKDHASVNEAARITELAAKERPQFIAKCGHTYSSEAFWSKVWHCLNVAPDIFSAAHSWVEIADRIPSVLAGIDAPEKIVRGICCAGHKALYADEWGGLPDKEFLRRLHPKLASLRDRLYEKAFDASTPAGALHATWASKLGLRTGIPIAVGQGDVHYGAVGCGVAEGVLVKVIGTSACDCAVVPANKKLADIPGVSGIVRGSILPGFYGIEAGQSAVGDIFKWWVEVVCNGDRTVHSKLMAEAAKLKPGESGLLALDWNNGNRNCLMDPQLTGLLLGQTLYTTRAEIYRALIEATAFGARAILERIKEYGVPVKRIVCAGGIAEKNPLLMQIYADVTACEMQVSASSHACALGGAVTAAVLARAHADFSAAQRAMTGVKAKTYKPIAAHTRPYERLYKLYSQLSDSFGGVNAAADLSRVMKQLLKIKSAQR
jgi:L-ribulokinase